MCFLIHDLVKINEYVETASRAELPVLAGLGSSGKETQRDDTANV